MKRQTLFPWMLLFLLIGLYSQALAQKVEARADGHRIKQAIEFMSNDAAMGRKPNTPEFDKKLDWAANQFAQWGLEPGGENGTYFQAVPIARDYAVTYGTPSLKIEGREFFTRYEDFQVDVRSTPGVKVKGSLVFVGHGISAPDKGLDEYAGVDVRGKWVLVLKGDPNAYEIPKDRFAERYTLEPAPEEEKGEDWSLEASDSTQMMVAYAKGAAGILFYNPQTGEQDPFRRFRPTVSACPFQRDFLVIPEISEEVFHWILWTDPQMSTSEFKNWFGQVRADIQNKKPRSFDTGLKVEAKGFDRVLLRGEQFGDGQCRNVIAKITGSDPELKKQMVVMGAHYDHVGVTNGQVFNGADDNASGSAVVMEVARLMKEHNIQPKRTVVFCLWTGEELGLIGSNYWVAHPTVGEGMDQVVTYFNMDMVGLGDNIGAPGALNFPSIWAVIQRDQDPDIIDVVKATTGGPGGSDHSAFISLGIESLALMTGGGGGHPDYHQTGDDPAKIEPEILGKTAQFVLQGTVNLANETETPLLLADRQARYDGLMWQMACINPALDMPTAWKTVEAATPAELVPLMLKKTEELRQPQDERDAMRRMFMRRFGGGNNLGTGMSVTALGYDLTWLPLVKDLLNVGRVDLAGEDGTWFSQGITEAGQSALKALEEQKMALSIQAPSEATLKSLMETVKKPFLVTEFTALDDELVAQINEKNVLLGVDFDPADVEGAVARLVDLKARFGDSDNLILDLQSAQELDQAKQTLYLALIQAGWTKEEIYAIGGAAGGSGWFRRGQGNLDKLAGGPPRMPRRPR